MQEGEGEVVDPLQAKSFPTHRNPFFSEGKGKRRHANSLYSDYSSVVFFHNPIIHCLSYFSGSKAEGSSIWSRPALCSSQEPPSNHRYISKKHKHCKVVTKIIIINPLSESPIKHYKHYSITRAYQGETFFWGLVPQVKTFSFKENTP